VRNYYLLEDVVARRRSWRSFGSCRKMRAEKWEIAAARKIRAGGFDHELVQELARELEPEILRRRAGAHEQEAKKGRHVGYGGQRARAGEGAAKAHQF
jgi:hypothetical protein